MPYYRALGEIPRKRHVQFRRPDGGLYAEELIGEEGVTSDSSLLYHRHAPTAIVESEGLLLLPAPARLRRSGGADPVQPPQCGQRRDDVLCRWRLPARKGSGIGIGSMSLHPSGFTHGPQPGAVEAVVEAVKRGHDRTTEMAVMIDTFRPLRPGAAARRCEDPEYAWTWARTAGHREDDG